MESKFQALGVLEYAHDESEEAEAPLYVVDDTNRGRWIKEEAVVDSGAVECVASRERVPHLRVEETLQSMRGEIWTCAGEKEIKEEGKSRARLDDGIMRVEKWSVQDMDGVPHMDQC